jgi:DNA helicase II / ATP-dependent DNA helicase PcrA
MTAPVTVLSHDNPEVLRDLLGIPFTTEQLVAATAPLEPGVIVAGAGSGKTSVMAARVVWLVATGQVRPEQVLGLTFTNKAAAELAQRLRDALTRLPGQVDGDPDGQPSVATYHAYAGRLLREYGARIGVEPQATLLADATRFQLAERVLRRARGPYVELDTTVSTLVGDVVSLDGELSEHLVDTGHLRAFDESLLAELQGLTKTTVAVREVARAARKRCELSGVVDLLRAEKVRRGVLDFGDQLAWATRLASGFPAVGAAERDRYRVVLLDEYQDTSVAQRVLLTALFSGSGSATGSGSGHPVTAVGDPCQAIYGWRGASVGNIDDFPLHFRRADGSPARRFTLQQNNRSGGLLLKLANALSVTLRHRHDGLPELQPRPGFEQAGHTQCGLFDTSANEVAWLADEVRSIVESGDYKPREIAILVRVRSDFAALHVALIDRGVPVEVVGLGGLLELPEVADLVAVLEVLDEPTANAALLRLLTGPRWRIGLRDLALLGRRATDLVRVRPGDDPDADPSERVDPAVLADRALEEAVAGVDPAEVVSLSEALERPGALPYSPQARSRFARLHVELQELQAHLGEPLLDLIRRVLATTGLEVEVRRPEGLLAFLDHAASFADLDGDPSLRAFLAFLAAAVEFDRGLDTSAPTPADSVKLMTVHKAKGLEWPVVILPDVTAGVFPTSTGRSRWTQAAKTLPTSLRGDAGDFPQVQEWTNAGLEDYKRAMKALDQLEERRLAYVGVTRAKDRLIATSHWWGPTQIKPRGPSAFLEEIREHCEAGRGEVVHWEPQPDEERNPALEVTTAFAWPPLLDPTAQAGRREGAVLVEAALHTIGSSSGADQLDLLPADVSGLSAQDVERLADWDRDVASLLAEAQAGHVPIREVVLPASLSASAVVRLAADPTALARDLARPMPRRPETAATRGTRFHAWVEAQFGVQPLIDRTDLVGAADDLLVDSDNDLNELQQAFLAGPYASRPPLHVEAPFQLVLGGRVVRGRIDAVYARDDGGFDVVDWKTGRQAADPLQLAIYRTAWARLAGVAPESVGAVFYYVASGRVVRPEGLASAEELAALLR